MDLKEYIYQKRLRQLDVAKAVNVRPCTICSFLKGHCKLGAQTAKRISLWTNGEVSIDELWQPTERQKAKLRKDIDEKV